MSKKYFKQKTMMKTPELFVKFSLHVRMNTVIMTYVFAWLATEEGNNSPINVNGTFP